MRLAPLLGLALAACASEPPPAAPAPAPAPVAAMPLPAACTLTAGCTVLTREQLIMFGKRAFDIGFKSCRGVEV